MTVRYDGLALSWLGYATARIEWPDGTVAYTDPGRYGVLTGEWEADSPAASAAHPPAADYRERDGDLVVVTHAHHYDPDGIDRVAGPDATVVVHEAVHAGSIERDVRPVDELAHDAVRVDDEADLLAADVVVRTTAAYNRLDGPNLRDDGSPIHPAGEGCGFLLDHDDRSVFWPGDTDVLDGHAELDVDVLLPPIGNFTMDRHAAAELAGALGPDLVVPIHYNTFGALEADSGAFAADVAGRGVPVALDER